VQGLRIGTVPFQARRDALFVHEHRSPHRLRVRQQLGLGGIAQPDVDRLGPGLETQHQVAQCVGHRAGLAR
jgi:hypothetical protein